MPVRDIGDLSVTSVSREDTGHNFKRYPNCHPEAPREGSTKFRAISPNSSELTLDETRSCFTPMKRSLLLRLPRSQQFTRQSIRVLLRQAAGHGVDLRMKGFRSGTHAVRIRGNRELYA